MSCRVGTGLYSWRGQEISLDEVGKPGSICLSAKDRKLSRQPIASTPPRVCTTRHDLLDLRLMVAKVFLR